MHNIVKSILLVLFVTTIVCCIPGISDQAPNVQITIQAAPKIQSDWPTSADKQQKIMENSRKTIESRLKGYQGISNPEVRLEGSNKIVITMRYSQSNLDSILKQLLSSGKIEFYYLNDINNDNNPKGKWRIDYSGDEYIFTDSQGKKISSINQPEEVLTQIVCIKTNKPILTNKDLLPNAKININQNNEVVLDIEFNNEGKQTFSKFTRRHVGDVLAVFYNGRLLTAPTINAPILSSKAEISGFKSLEEARKTADNLNIGSLPIPFKVVEKKNL